MTGPRRITQGLLTRAGEPVEFRFDGLAMHGLAGDTLASALLANGVRVVGRSFKYHRARGIVTAGPEEPCALVDVIGAQGREPNRLATTLNVYEGLVAESQNRWPSLEFDVMAINGLLARFLPAGFYYKTFMEPGWAWEKFYEPLIRRAAGLGRLEPIFGEHAEPAEIVHDHTDVLVVGAGAAGLAAAHRLALGGLRVILADQDVTLGGGTLLDTRWNDWREGTLATLSRFENVRCLVRTAVFGAYGHGVFGALETLADGASPASSLGSPRLRERLHVIRAKRIVLAAGAVERLIAFRGNDRPGVMLAGAGLAYLRRYGVAVGEKPALFANNDEAYEIAFALHDAGIRSAGIVDPRETSAAADRARALGLMVHAGARVTRVDGRNGVRRIRISFASAPALASASGPALAPAASRAPGGAHWLEADCLLMSGGYSPATALASQLGAALVWNEAIAAFTPVLDHAIGEVAGAARGGFGLAAAARDGVRAAQAIVVDLARGTAAHPAAAARVHGAPASEHVAAAQLAWDAARRNAAPLPPAAGARPSLRIPPDANATPLAPLWEVRGRGKAFVDLQNDVTAADVRLAAREGYEHVEHMKRYTTHGMATDQGRIGGLTGSAVLADARGVHVSEVGQSKPRPFYPPVSFAALAGGEVRSHYKPKRRLPLHDAHEAAGATFVSTGLWLRPLVYSQESGWDPVLAEARAVRRSVGITDVSTLGKIDVQGPDAARFLDFIYANTFSTLAIDRARYGIMLREDGVMMDDGTTSRLAPEHFVVTTTTANTIAVLEHMEFHRQANCAELDVVITDVTDQWAQFAVAGPRAREIVAAIVSDLDLSNEAFPFMAAAEAIIADVPGRLFRISFSGELAYELSVPAACAAQVWSAVLEAGKPADIVPYGLDALNTLRIEKGHVTGAELNGNTTADDLGFGRMLKKQGDFIGRALAQRSALAAPDRLQLVGVRPADHTRRLRNGAQIVTSKARKASLGFITSSTPATEYDGWVGLALLANGRQRIGQTLVASSPIHDDITGIEILSPHMLDPENRRVRA